jgi:alpha-N-arabinofuranosidase
MTATIKLDRDRQIGTVDRRILSGFAEHLGRCIYGGIYDEGSPLADSDGFRTDVIEAVKALKPPILRWPGGNFVSGYHWTDGIGAPDSRPRRLELAWHSEESNRFGTDEFMRFCDRVGAEPYLCVNMGSGSIDEAQAWVEYCNGTGTTEWANLRRANGHEEPYGVRYWGLGNEMYGPWQIGALCAEDYVKRAREFAKVMSWTDPGIELVGCGENGLSDWDRVVVEGLADKVRWHSIHIYTGSDDYWTDVLSPHQAERALRRTAALIALVRYRQKIAHPIHVAYDEWNVWFRERENGLEERYTLADALAVATYLHAFVRHCGLVRMANLAQLVNVIAPIVTRPDGLFLQTIYHPMRLFADHLRPVALDVHVDCDTHDHVDHEVPGGWPHRVADLGPFPVLDVAATAASEADGLTVSVVNRSPSDAVDARIRFADATETRPATVQRVTGPDPGATNSFEHPDRVTVETEQLDAFADGTVIRFPAHSHTVITTGPAQGQS